MQLLERPRRVRPITSAPGTNHHPYFYSHAFSSDERFVAFGSDRTGRFEIYSLELATGVERQLTDAPLVNTQSMTFGWTGWEIYYVRENRIWAVQADSGNERLVADFRPLCSPGNHHTRPVFPRDMSRMVFYFPHASGAPAVAWADPQGGPVQVAATYPELERVVHVLVNPSDRDFVTFDPFPDRQQQWHLGERERARCWHLDLRTGDTKPFLVMPEGFRATHEFWNHDGSRLYFHRKTVPGWTPAAVCSMRRDRSDLRVHFSSGDWKLGHGNTDPTGRWLVTDAQDAGRNPLILVELASGRAEVPCWPNASGADHPRHVHPSFSPSGRYLIYTSDATGDAHVHLLELPPPDME